MLKPTLLATLMVGMLFVGSGCCGGLRNWVHCGHPGGGPCGGSCGSDACSPGRLAHWRGILGVRACDPCNSPVTRGRCDVGFGCGTGLFDLFGWGCGKMYWGDHIAVPVDRCEPCDQHGNWTGHGHVHQGAVHHHGSMTHMPYEGEVIYDGPEMPMEVHETVVPHSAKQMSPRRQGMPTPAKPLASRPRVAY